MSPLRRERLHVERRGQSLVDVGLPHLLAPQPPEDGLDVVRRLVLVGEGQVGEVVDTQGRPRPVGGGLDVGRQGVVESARPAPGAAPAVLGGPADILGRLVSPLAPGERPVVVAGRQPIPVTEGLPHGRVAGPADEVSVGPRTVDGLREVAVKNQTDTQEVHERVVRGRPFSSRYDFLP